MNPYLRASRRISGTVSTQQARTMASGSSVPALMTPFSLKTNPSIKLPKFIYGTAWKKDRTATLVYQALKAGFRAIDTAAQPRHYNEKQVGEGVAKAISEGIVKREDIYIQTKFTPPSGQDPINMPYRADQSIMDQVHTSVASSLSHMTFPNSGEPYIDCLVLHSPYRDLENTILAWKTFSTYVPNNIRSLGISNTTLPVLQSLVGEETPPSVVQNRFYPDTRWENDLRRWCRENEIIFQSFWTLTGNPKLMQSRAVGEVAEALKAKEVKDEKAVAMYGLVLGLKGVTVLCGTTNEERMRSNLNGLRELGGFIEGDWKDEWAGWLGDFKDSIGDV